MPVHTTHMGNVATEDLVYLFESCGVRTGIDAEAIASIGRHAQKLIGAGQSYATAFGTLDSFLQANKAQLERISEAPPGDSHVTA